MLQCTQAAASTLRHVREQEGIPETYGLRVFPAQAPTGEVNLQLGFVEAPADGDQVNEAHGERLFVAPEIAEDLSALALDAVSDPTTDGAAPAQLVLVPAADTA
jgi:Fe-S cluster assembly iron-binding protein IscA